MSTPLDNAVRKMHDECNSYTDTVMALRAIAHELRWDSKAKAPKLGTEVSFGRRMQTTDGNRVSKSREVTPDLVIQLDNRSGVIAEAKTALSSIAERRRSRLLEIQKYDDNLKGWLTPTETVESHSIVLLVHLHRDQEVAQQITELTTEGAFKMDRSFAVVSFAVITQGKTYFTLSLAHGSLLDREKEARLRRRTPIDMEHLAGNPEFATLKLYDAPPPVPLLMDLIQQCIASRLTPEQRDTFKDIGYVDVPVRVEVLTRWMAEDYGPRCRQGARAPEIPPRSWVHDAMDRFVELGWAKEPDSKAYGLFVYTYKRRVKPFEKFLKHCAQIQLELEQKKVAAESWESLPLFAHLKDQ